MKNVNSITALLWTLLVLSADSHALPEDNQQPINIQADRATQQSLQGSERTEYFGRVVMTQGSLLVNADHLVIHSVDRKVTHIEASGTPARFQQQSQPETPPVVARANKIDYRLETKIVILTDNAHINQPDASFSGNRIEYNVGTEEVQAEDRVNMIFAPSGSAASDGDDAAISNKDDHGQTDGQ